MKITGPDALVKPQAYTTLALVLHEMATNSVKYGALCDSRGRVDINISQDNAGGLLMMNDIPVEAMRAISMCTRLEKLDLSQNGLGDENVAHIVSSCGRTSR